MKNTFEKGSILLFIGILVFITGCASLKPEIYSFVPAETNTASITFIKGNTNVYFISYDGGVLPQAEEGTYWDPIVFPAGKPLKINVQAVYNQNSNSASSGFFLLDLAATITTTAISANRSVNTEVIFNCPALKSGEYSLEFKKGSGVPGKNRLILIDLTTNKIIYEQEFNKQEDS